MEIFTSHVCIEFSARHAVPIERSVKSFAIMYTTTAAISGNDADTTEVVVHRRKRLHAIVDRCWTYLSTERVHIRRAARWRRDTVATGAETDGIASVFCETTTATPASRNKTRRWKHRPGASIPPGSWRHPPWVMEKSPLSEIFTSPSLKKSPQPKNGGICLHPSMARRPWHRPPPSHVWYLFSVGDDPMDNRLEWIRWEM